MAVNINIHGLVYKRLKCGQHKICGSGLCYLCNFELSPGEIFLCTSCRNDLPLNNNACAGCAMPLMTGVFCSACINESNPLIFRTRCLYKYTYPVNRLIQDMKFNSRPGLARYFGQELLLRFPGNLEKPEYFIPVPLHTSRLRQRGYNQSLELARFLSSATGVPLDENSVFRKRKTLAQSELPANQRKRNIRGAFAINSHALSGYDHVAIIDDVVTTGATVNEIARLLKKTGVRRIDVWACARASI